MPIYEYLCSQCGRRTSLLVLSRESTEAPRCRACGSAEVARVPSRFATPRSEEARVERLMDPARLGGLDPENPQDAARAVREWGREMGEEGEELEEMAEELAAGGEDADAPADLTDDGMS